MSSPTLPYFKRLKKEKKTKAQKRWMIYVVTQLINGIEETKRLWVLVVFDFAYGIIIGLD